MNSRSRALTRAIDVAIHALNRRSDDGLGAGHWLLLQAVVIRHLLLVLIPLPVGRLLRFFFRLVLEGQRFVAEQHDGRESEHRRSDERALFQGEYKAEGKQRGNRDGDASLAWIILVHADRVQPRPKHLHNNCDIKSEANYSEFGEHLNRLDVAVGSQDAGVP